VDKLTAAATATTTTTANTSQPSSMILMTRQPFTDDF